MSFNFDKYKANNPLLQEIEEEITVSSSGVEMEEDYEDGSVKDIEAYGSGETEELEGMGSQMDEDAKYPLIAVEKAALAAKKAGIDRETVVTIVNQTYGQGMSANLPK